MDEIRFFKLHEFGCGCGCGQSKMNLSFVKKLDSIRDECGFPFIVNSGFRCRDWMQQVGSITSSHGLGLAADIAVTNNLQRLHLVDTALSHLVRRIGIYPTFVHLDVDPNKTPGIWWGE